MENRHTLWVAGCDYRQKDLIPLLWDENDDFKMTKKEFLEWFDEDDRVYQYEKEYYDLHIQAEPDNPYDPHTVKVFADDAFVGYVPSGHFEELLQMSSIPGVKASVEVFGGKYKYLEYDEEEDYLGTMENKYYHLRTETDPVKAVMVFEW